MLFSAVVVGTEHGEIDSTFLADELVDSRNLWGVVFRFVWLWVEYSLLGQGEAQAKNEEN